MSKQCENAEEVIHSDKPTENYPGFMELYSEFQLIVLLSCLDFYSFSSLSLLLHHCFWPQQAVKTALKTYCTLPAQHQMADRQTSQLAGELSGVLST